MAINETATGKDGVAVTGTATGEATVGVLGKGDSVGVRGEGKGWHGVAGISDSTIGGFGVFGGHTQGGPGVVGESTGWTGGPGVVGESTGTNVQGTGGDAVYGTSDNGVGVRGRSVNNVGVWAESDKYEGLHAVTQSTTTAALAAYQANAASTTAALYAKHVAGSNGRAAHFEGSVFVTGDVELANADCAEDFDVSAESSAEPGSVMVLDEEGNLRESCHPYDNRVAGVVSGAGNYKPGLVLDKQQSESDRKPIALMGKVFCKVDADRGPIHTGDMLTTSDTPGHAMKAADPTQAFGAVIGKALRSLPGGRGLVPILVALQ